MLSTRLANLDINEVDKYMTTALLEAMKNRSDVIKENIQIDTSEQLGNKTGELVSDFANSFFKYNDYEEGSYNNNWLVSEIYKSYKIDAYKIEGLSYLVYAAVSSFINSCFPYTDIEEVTGMDDADAMVDLRDKFMYKYLTWAFSSPDDKYIKWNFFNKRASLYNNVGIEEF